MVRDALTVIIPAHKAAPTLPRAIESVQCQRDAPRIIVVVDGADPDTEAAAHAYTGVRIKVNRDCIGAPASRNAGLALVETEYVAFLDADDYIEGDLHQGMVDAIGQADMVISSWAWEHPSGHRDLIPVSSIKPLMESRDRLAAHWIGTQFFQTGSVGWRTDYLRRIGGWDVSLRKGQDFEVGLRSILSGGRIEANRKGLAVHVNHEAPTRITKIKTASVIEDHQRVLRQVEEYAEKSRHRDLMRVALGQRYYQLACNCFIEGTPDEGQWALSQARRLGISGHQGSFQHRLACYAVGLERKQYLGRIVATIKSGVKQMLSVE